MKKLNLTSLQKRILSAAILVPIVLWMIASGGWVFLVLVCGWGAVSLYEWIQLSLKTSRKVTFSVFGVIYVSLCFWACYMIGLHFEFALLFIVMVWASDVGGYIFGKTIGGPKMSPKLSPNKTWAGLGGAIVSPVLCGAVFLMLFGKILPLYMEWSFLLLLGVVVGLSGQAGDLLISWLKRQAGAKDSGQLIPGHGGVLDRVDALMLSALVVSLLLLSPANFHAY